MRQFTRVLPLIYLLMLLLAIFISCKSLTVARSKNSDLAKSIMAGFDQLEIKFINQEIFDRSRELFFNNHVKINDSDTIIVIEYFVDVNGNYAACAYSDGSINCYRVLKEFEKHKYSLKYVNASSFTDHILSLLIKGEVNEILSKGQSPYTSPATIVIITKAIIVDSDLKVDSYRCFDFKIE